MRINPTKTSFWSGGQRRILIMSHAQVTTERPAAIKRIKNVMGINAPLQAIHCWHSQHTCQGYPRMLCWCRGWLPGYSMVCMKRWRKSSVSANVSTEILSIKIMESEDQRLKINPAQQVFICDQNGDDLANPAPLCVDAGRQVTYEWLHNLAGLEIKQKVRKGLYCIHSFTFMSPLCVSPMETWRRVRHWATRNPPVTNSAQGLRRECRDSFRLNV